MKSVGYTDHISRHTAENICHAFDFAKFIGKPLNQYIVINFDPSISWEPTTLFARIRDKFRDWLSYHYKKRGLTAPSPVYIYSFENPSDGQPHVNWAVHVPVHLQSEFSKRVAVWVKRSTGNLRPFDIKVQGVDPFTDKTLTKYVIKGTDEKYVKYLHLEKVACPQGRVWGRRATASPSISRSARKAVGFKAKRDRHLWKEHLKAA